MSPHDPMVLTPRLQEALDELRGLVAARYPDATFDLFRGEDPEGVYLSATADVENLYDLIDIVLDRLVDLQVEENLPVYFAPRRTPEREASVRARLRRPLLVGTVPPGVG